MRFFGGILHVHIGAIPSSRQPSPPSAGLAARCGHGRPAAVGSRAPGDEGSPPRRRAAQARQRGGPSGRGLRGGAGRGAVPKMWLPTLAGGGKGANTELGESKLGFEEGAKEPGVLQGHGR